MRVFGRPWRDPGLYVVMLANLLLVAIAFNKVVFNPAEIVLYADYDGGKNYFTPYSYISGLGLDETHAHPLKVYGQNYPFGEYVFYTDNTPLLSIPMRALATLGVPTPSGGVAALSCFFLLLTWLTAPVLYLFLRDLGVSRWISVLFSLIVPYVNKQVWHLSFGSPNLGLTVLTVALLWLLLKIWRNPEKRKAWLTAAVLIGLSAWIHLYYLIIYGTTLALFSLALAWHASKRDALATSAPPSKRYSHRHPAVRILVLAGLSGALAIAIIYLPILGIDRELAARTGQSLGFNFEAWRLDVRTLITPPPELGSRFLVSYAQPMFGEKSGYLGLWILYTVVGLFIHKLTRGSWVARPSLNVESSTFVKIIVAVGLVCFFASLGTVYSLPGGELEFQVILNPFYAFVKSVPVLQQFRATARFFFVTHVAWSIALIFVIDSFWKAASAKSQPAKYGALTAIIAIAFLGYIDARDYISARNAVYHVNPTGTKATSDYTEALAELELEDYQALLVAPYYHIGSETIGLVADPDYQLQRTVWTLAAATRLPLINAVTSRTPPYQARQLFAYATTGVASDTLAALMDERPVLLAVHEPSRRRLANGGEGYPVPQEGIARTAVPASLELPTATGAEYLKSVGEFHFYRMPVLRQANR